ncbi:MAG: hypothetical protein ACREB9_06190 [Thermoplasmata archaeon]
MPPEVKRIRLYVDETNAPHKSLCFVCRKGISRHQPVRKMHLPGVRWAVGYACTCHTTEELSHSFFPFLERLTAMARRELRAAAPQPVAPSPTLSEYDHVRADEIRKNESGIYTRQEDEA